MFWKELPCKYVNKHWRFGAAQYLQLALQICTTIFIKQHICAGRKRCKMYCWTGTKAESFLSLLHCAIFVRHCRRSHSLQCCTALSQFSLQRASHSYKSTVNSPPTICIASCPVWCHVFLSTEAMLPEHVHYSTVTLYISLSDRHFSRWKKLTHTLTV